MMKSLGIAAIAAGALLVAGAAGATPYHGSTGIGDAAITFDTGLAQNASLAYAYTAQGVTFGGAFQDYEDTGYFNTDGVNAANFTRNSASPSAGAITLDFSSPISAISFSINSDDAGVRIYSFLDGNLVESFKTTTDYTSSDNFYGFTGSSFDYLLIDPGSTSNDFVLDNISFGSAAPEPGTWAMMFAGVAMIGGLMRARRRAELRHAALVSIDA